MREALYYNKLDNKAVKCKICPNLCIVQSSKSGACMSRVNIEGLFYALNYGQTVSINLDPIEKKPLYHYYPGSMILSIGANSCNLHCGFCQNYEISQHDCVTNKLLPYELLDIMIKKKLKQIAFTYTEPFTWFEFILDCGKLFKPNEIKIVLVTNGYVNQEPLLELLPYIDAMNIDLKSFSDDFYIKMCKGSLQPVLDTIRIANASCHIELTNLLIPNLNDGAEEITQLVNFVASINKSIPLHFSRYFPRWKCKESITPMETLQKAYNIARTKLDYVYIGNIQSGDYCNTYCPNCSTLLIDRNSSQISSERLQENKCSKCNKVIYGRY
jgi:pyruvate formate lyase activating enzyme